MKLIAKWSTSIVVALFISCSTMPPKRQYIRELERQAVPKELLDSEWALETFDNRVPDCSITMTFLDKGQFIFKFKDEVYKGENLWYIVKDSSVIEFHTRPLEKMAWTKDECQMNPSVFSLYLAGNKKLTITGSKLSFVTFDKRRFVFIKT